jgi:uncharacterized protein YdaU (DUF1376 family)
MAEQRPYFPFYPKDWLGSASVSAMPLAAQGLYARLLSFAWLSDGLPADEDALRRLASVERVEWKRVWPLVAPLWEERDGRLYQGKQERVRQEQTAYTTAKSLAGQKGGRRSVEARTEVFGSPDPRSNREAHHEAEREARGESGAEAVVKPSSASASAKKRTPQPPEGADPLFARFWDAYPRHTGKANAEKAWRKLGPDEDLVDTMLAALAWQRRQPSWTKDGGAFIPHPASWLNQRRWEDEHPDGALNGTILDDDRLPDVDWRNV